MGLFQTKMSATSARRRVVSVATQGTSLRERARPRARVHSRTRSTVPWEVSTPSSSSRVHSLVASREKPLVRNFSSTIVEVASATRSFLTNTQVARVPKCTMSRVSAHALVLVLSLSVLVSGVQAQTKPTDAVGTNSLPVYSITADEWSDDVLDDPSETVVAVTSAGSCVCDLTEGACDGNCCCDPDCTVRARRLVPTFSTPRRRPTSRFVSVFPARFSRSTLTRRARSTFLAFAVHRARAVHRALRR